MHSIARQKWQIDRQSNIRYSVSLHAVMITLVVVIYLRQKRRYMFLPVFVCLSVCLSARLLKNVCMDLDEMLRVDTRQMSDMNEMINL